MQPLRGVMKVAVVGSPTMTSRQAEPFDRLLDTIAEAVVERYLAELEAAAGGSSQGRCDDTVTAWPEKGLEQ